MSNLMSKVMTEVLNILQSRRFIHVKGHWNGGVRGEVDIVIQVRDITQKGK